MGFMADYALRRIRAKQAIQARPIRERKLERDSARLPAPALEKVPEILERPQEKQIPLVVGAEPKEKKTNLSVYLARDERDLLVKHARRVNLTFAEWARRVLLREVRTAIEEDRVEVPDKISIPGIAHPKGRKTYRKLR